jgi:hypothetical protein
MKEKGFPILLVSHMIEVKKDIVVLICKGDVEHEEVIIPLRIFKDIISCPIRI